MAEAYLPYQGCGPQAKSIAKAEVTLDFSTVTYDGSDHAPAVQSVSLNGKELRADHDYVYTAVRYKDAGNYNVQVMGINEYGGVKQVPWHITKAQGSIRVEPAQVTIQGAAGTTATVNIVSTGDGEISVSQSQYVTSKVSGKQITLTSVKEGSDTLTVTLGEGRNYTGSSAELQVEVSNAHIWGVKWDGQPGTKWVRTDDATDFADPVPYYTGMQGNPSSPVDEFDPWKSLKDTVEDPQCGKCGTVKKFWYELKAPDDGGLSIRIADDYVEGFVVDPIHMAMSDTEPEVDTVLIGCYHCADGTHKSETGKAQWCNVTHSNCRTGIQALGDHIYMNDFAIRFTLWLLFLVEFADWNSEKIGRGCSVGGSSSSKENNGITDSLPYHTGTTASSRDEYGFTKYRNIEGLWDNVYDWLDGCYYDANGLNIIKDPAKYADTQNGTLVGKAVGGYPSKFQVTDVAGFPMFYPIEAQGSTSTYTCDSWNVGSGSYPCLYAGGVYSHNQDRGLFFLGYGTVSSAGAGVGGRLHKRVPNGGV